MPWRLIPLSTTPKPPSAARTYENAVRLLETKQWQAAIAAFENVLDSRRTDALTGELARFYLCEAHLGLALSVPNDAETALFHLRAASELGPDYADVFYHLGRIYLEQNRDDAARAALDRAVFINPGYARAHLLRGVLLCRSGEIEGGLLVAEVAAALDSSLSADLLGAAQQAGLENNTAEMVRVLLLMNGSG